MIAAASCLPTAVPEAAFRKPEGVLAIVCPGQGAQTPGLLSPWLELPGLSDHLARLAEACGVDLLRHGTVSDAETIRDTAVAQPLIVACGLLALGELFPDRTAGALVDPDRVVALGGHSGRGIGRDRVKARHPGDFSAKNCPFREKPVPLRNPPPVRRAHA